MKAVTICQPYAHLVCVDRTKRVENRTWATSHRCDLLIHAGKSRAWLDVDDGTDIAAMTFGALIGIATLVDCLDVVRIRAGAYDERYPWLREHVHTNGPWCWVLDNVRALTRPVPYRGAQGLFNVPDDLVAGVLGGTS